jgi:glycosyltransferase involved in cell wall biosynthesis
MQGLLDLVPQPDHHTDTAAEVPWRAGHPPRAPERASGEVATDKTPRLKILLVTDWFLKLVVEGQAVALSELGHEVRLLCGSHLDEFAGDADERTWILNRIRAAGVRVLELPGRRFGPEGIPAMLAAQREIRRWSPDVVSAHQNDDPRLLFASRGAPLVYTIHDPEPHPGAQSPRRRERVAAAAWLRVADCVVVHSESLVTELPERVRRKSIRVIPHGIEVQSDCLPRPAEDVVLLFGRMEPYKGAAVLADAMQEVWAARPGAKLVVAGRGPAVADIPSDDRIELIARYISESELRRLLTRATVVALPYTQASQSGVGLLSISYGVPIVVTRVGALPDLVPDVRYVAEPNDPRSLASTLLASLAAAPDERARFLEHARASFSWQRVAEAYSEVYRDLSSGLAIESS